MTEPKWYDLTVWPHQGYTMERLIEIFDKECERYVIGKEIAPTTGREHFQCRVVFKVGKTEGAVTNLVPGSFVTPSHVRDFQYCEKEGEYYRSWEKGLQKFATIELMQWQGEMVCLLKESDDRRVNVIIDPEGGWGKTWASKYCQVNHIAQYVPPLAKAEDFMAFAMAKPSKAYVFDMPRASDVKKVAELWSAIEQIKNGYLYDKRYQFRDMWIESPAIVVITNEKPPYDSLSPDRWKCYRITQRFGDAHLEEYDPWGVTM